MNRRLLAFFLAFVMVISHLPGNVWAVEADCLDAYEDLPLQSGQADTDDESEIDLGFGVDIPDVFLLDTSIYGSRADAAAALRKAMVERKDSVTVYFVTTNTNGGEDVLNLLDEAMEHTGNPLEGDYLKWQRSKIRYSYYPQPQYYNGKYYQKATYQLSYYTTAQQEAQLTTAVDALLESLELEGKSDYQKFSAIYHYLCANITYDDENLEDESYNLKYSAYAALANKTSVCQGYANLLYRLLLTVGIDCRLISGTGNGGGHAWNIVKLGDYYYNVDATWDATWYTAIGRYGFCLQSEANFDDHLRSAEYDTAAFHAAYPMAQADYVDPGHTMTWYPAAEPTGTTAGNTEYWYCSRCGKYFGDANGSNEILKDSWILPATGPEILWGDADKDGQVTAADATAIKAYRVGLTDGSELDLIAGDLDGNGIVDVYDAYLIQLFVAKKISKFPVE